MFSEDGSRVALIRKIKPDWQAGKLNAIGGKIEGDEPPHEAMSREFFEEAGVLHFDWEHMVCLYNEHFECHFFRAFSDIVFDVETMEEEVVAVYNVADIEFERTMPNLDWLIPLCLDRSIAGNIRVKDIS